MLNLMQLPWQRLLVALTACDTNIIYVTPL